MITTDSKKLQSQKNSIQSTVHQSPQIRTNKHRCFVFCIGHTSLTCVPGIGKKNKYLLNQSGIHDLSTLYSKYRSINNIQHFKQWLQNDIGFTSYQAKMTACGIGTKLGEIKETNTGLIPIYCRSKERREEKYKLFSYDQNIKKRNRSSQSETEKNKEEGIKKQKIENISPSSNQDERGKNIPIKDELFISSGINNQVNKLKDDQTSVSSDKKLMNKLSDNYLTGVKSPSDPIFATRSPLMKDNDESDSSSSPNKLSFDRKYEANELFKTKSMVDQTPHDHNDSLESTKQTSPSLEKDSMSNIDLNSPLPSTFEQSKINQTPNNIHEKIGSKILKSESHSDQQKKNDVQLKKSSIIYDSILQQVDSIPSSELFTENKRKSEGSLSNSNVIPQHFNSPQDTTTNHRPISFSQVSTDDIKQDADQKKSLNSRLEFQDEIVREKHQSPSLPVSRPDTNDNQTEQGSSSKEKKSLSHFNLDDLPVNKSFIDKRASTELSPTVDEKLNEIFTLTKQKLQPTLDALHDKKDELLSTSKKSSDSSISNVHPKSILCSTQSKPASPINADLLYGAIKEQQRQIKNKPFQTMSSPETARTKPAVNNDDTSSDIKTKLEEGSPDETDNKSISSIKPSYTSLLVSTPAVFPIKSKSMKKSDISNSIKSTSENYLTPMDPEGDITNIASLVNHSSISPPTEQDDPKPHDKITPRSISNTNTYKDKSTSSPISENKEQESIPDQHDSSFNEFQQEMFRKEISKAISQIMTQAAHIVHDDIQFPHVNAISSTKINATESSSLQTSLYAPLTQSKAKELMPATESNERERSSQSFEQLKHLSTKTSSTDLGTQFENEKLKPTQSDPYEMSENRLLPVKETSNDHESDKGNQSDKALTTTNKQTNYDRLQLTQSSSISKLSTSINVSPLMSVPEHNRGSDFDSSSLPISHKNDPLTNLVLSEIKQQISSINKSSELLKTKPLNEKKSLSTLSSLSDSNQSINRINLSIDKIQFNSTPNIIPNPIDYLKKDEPDISIMPFNRINQLINKNLSETINSKENSELKEKIFDNYKLKTISNTTDSKYLSISSPSFPIPCNAFWDNISNEKILFQRKNHHFKLIRKKSI